MGVDIYTLYSSWILKLTSAAAIRELLKGTFDKRPGAIFAAKGVAHHVLALTLLFRETHESGDSEYRA